MDSKELIARLEAGRAEGRWLICLAFRKKPSASTVGSKIIVRVVSPDELWGLISILQYGFLDERTRLVEQLFPEDFSEIRRVDLHGELRWANQRIAAINRAKNWQNDLEAEYRPAQVHLPPETKEMEGGHDPVEPHSQDDPGEEVEEPIEFEQELEEPMNTEPVVQNAVVFNGEGKRQVLKAWLRILKRRMR